MATVKVPIKSFMESLRSAYKRHDGYIMGAKGQNPKKWAVDSWWYNQYRDGDYTEAQYKKALYWREHAERVWDCNGLAEGIYEDFTGVNINTKARYNYANWCDPKGSGTIPTKYRVAGAAIFWGKSASSITHVAYLDAPVEAGKPEGDWYIIEARGVSYGVVRTRLNERKPNYWGWMTKYFDYENAAYEPTKIELGSRTLSNDCEGDDVRELQSDLIRLGYDCGKWGADGDFGDATEMAVRRFQRDHGLKIDGIYGQLTHAALEKALAQLDRPVENPKHVKVVGGNCWIRTEPNTSGDKLAVASEGSTFVYANQQSEDGWNCIIYQDAKAWVSGKYSEVVA